MAPTWAGNYRRCVVVDLLLGSRLAAEVPMLLRPRLAMAVRESLRMVVTSGVPFSARAMRLPPLTPQMLLGRCRR
ncbi:hypothetical protein MRX96_004829 [Rhipicephalus microplus]